MPAFCFQGELLYINPEIFHQFVAIHVGLPDDAS